MSKKGKADEIWKFILEARNILLTTHVRPDGDGIASELALLRILKSQNKHVCVFNQDKTPDMYAWLPGAEQIYTIEEGIEPSIDTLDLVILLDCASRERIGVVSERIQHAGRIISLDHHEDSECPHHGCYVDTEVSSIGELFFSLIPDIEEHLDRDIATCIYVSILTDTGSFAFANTTKKVFRIVSSLLNYGVEPDYAHQMIYNQRSIQHFRLLGKALERLQVDCSGSIVSVLLPMSVYGETGASNEDNEGILEVIRGLKNCRLIIMLRQLDEHRVKGSLRSTNNVNCNYLAKLFGGGGHLKASGFVVNGDVNEIGLSIVEKICSEVKGKGWV